MDLTLLVIADLHYVNHAEYFNSHPHRKVKNSHIFLQKAFSGMKIEGIRPDVAILLGDIIDNGEFPEAETDLQEIAATVKKWGIPVLALPGNHDGDFNRFAQIFNTRPGLHVIQNYGFIVFHDKKQNDEKVFRSNADLEMLRRIRESHPELPLIALQHNPLHPHIESFYPYNPANAESVLKAYQQNQVMLSLSGHYHRGQAAHKIGDVIYYTVPAICEAPFRFAHIKLSGWEVKLQEHALKLAVDGLMDVHCHTEFGKQ
jgi:Icc-related predicted phosphoesterase